MTDEHEIKPPSKLKPILLGIVVLALLIGGIGSIGVASGAGFFSYRTFLYGMSDLYVLNMGPEPMWVSVDGREKVEVPAKNAKVVEIIGGESSVQAMDAAGQVKGRYTVDARNSHAFLKLTDDDCLAVIDLDPFYRGGTKQDIKFVALLNEKTRVWVPGSRNVVWPRKDFPTALTAQQGPGMWVELVGCPLLEDTVFLDAYIALRLEERIKKAKGGGENPSP